MRASTILLPTSSHHLPDQLTDTATTPVLTHLSSVYKSLARLDHSPQSNLTFFSTMEVMMRTDNLAKIPAENPLNLASLLDNGHPVPEQLISDVHVSVIKDTVIEVIDIGIFKNLLMAGINPNSTNSKGNTLLAIAMKNRWTLKNGELCAALYKKGARVTDLAAFSRICECQPVSWIEKLISNGTDIAGRRERVRQGLIIFHRLAANSKYGLSEKRPVLDLLHQVMPGLLDEPAIEGTTPLHLATTCRSDTLVSYLLDKGANIEALSSDCGNPLNCAVYLGDSFIISRLLTKIDRTRRPSERRDDFEVILRISQEQETEPSHTGVYARDASMLHTSSPY
ncbi:hypothetical protein BDV38DRAFT_279129 [Aspergillus pseudotamarii]|uniref:Ankyrin repeat-containing domain protein n=1 Tax=Aspergillus pseudotamarii TaxID=132259 RepID=A0A5N6T4U9_ASPPS|nr:uncharacterized protein BDV38DRAFT_279129 [Aspergillus pseudotamarii]KAE8141221.1 hypothetical protein BDV38DRAFT_279129 [Aspergillus pseudotamarii]